MSWLAVLAAALLFAIYLRSPIDFIPDRVGPLGLLDDLLMLLVAIWWVRRQLGGARPQRQQRGSQGAGSGAQAGATDSDRAGDDPYGVLGIARDASPEEITRAYREQMKRYHPDRVAGLGEELQRVAHRKTVEIQRAYEALRRS